MVTLMRVLQVCKCKKSAEKTVFERLCTENNRGILNFLKNFQNFMKIIAKRTCNTLFGWVHFTSRDFDSGGPHHFADADLSNFSENN